jgi:hypothetical protein
VNSAQGQSCFVGKFSRAIDTNGGPAEPRANRSRRLEAHPPGADAGHHGFELDDAMTAALEQLSGPSEDAKRITAQPDIAIGKQDGLPATGTGQGFENIPTKHGRSTSTRDPDCRRRLVDS